MRLEVDPSTSTGYRMVPEDGSGLTPAPAAPPQVGDTRGGVDDDGRTYVEVWGGTAWHRSYGGTNTGEDLTGPPGPPGSVEGMSESLVALGFLKFMQKPLRYFKGFADVKMLEYAPDYTGPVRGQFTAHEPVVTPATPIEVGAPTGVIPHLYRGLVYGLENGWVAGDTIRVYKNNVEVPACLTTPGDGGFFAVDLGPAPIDLPVGPWKFQVYRGGGPFGNPWPQVPLFQNTNVELHVITDADYLISTIPADTSGEFYFPTCQPGDKRVAVVYNGTDLLGEACPVPALLRSYITDGFPGDATGFETTSYVYDQGVAICAALAMGDSQYADDLKRGLMKHRDNSGRFRFVRQQEGTAYGDLFMRTGAHAWAVYGWLKWLDARPEKVELDRFIVTQSIDYMLSLESTSGPTQGLILGGSGQYLPDGSGGQIFDPSYVIPWASSEHNIDAYFVLKLAAKVLGEPSYLDRANALATVMYEKLWTGTRLRQGVQPTGNDDAYALDCHTWGAVFLLDAGYPAEAQLNFSHTDLFRFTIDGVTGYAQSFDSPGYPGLLPNVWAEGTFGWVLAARFVGAPYQDILDGMLAVQRPDGSWPYVMQIDVPYEQYPYPCSISAGWAIPAIVGRGIWDDD